MKRKVIRLIYLISVVLLVVSLLAACGDKSENNKDKEENYPVVGIWRAGASWHEDNPYNYGGDTYVLNVYYNFMEDGTAKLRSTMSLNGTLMTDTGWNIINMTWTVSKKTITFSNGKKFVIVDDEFNDSWPDPRMILHFKKEVD